MSAKLFVGQLAWVVDDERLRQAFSDYGRVVNSVVVKDKMTGRSRGFGFVTYETEQEAETALNSMNGYSLEGRTIRVDRASSDSGPRDSPGPGGFGGNRGPRREGGGRGYDMYGGGSGGYGGNAGGYGGSEGGDYGRGRRTEYGGNSGTGA